MKSLGKFFVAFAVLALAAVPASADTMCASGSICTVTLSNANVTSLAGVSVTVTINNTGATTVLTVQFGNNPLTNTPLGIDEFDYNGNSLTAVPSGGGTDPRRITSVVDLGASDTGSACDGTTLDCWTIHQGGTTAGGGFGTFASGSDHNSGGTGGVNNALTFTLASLVTNFLSNGNGSTFIVHVRFDQNCSGWISDGTSSSVTTDPNCTAVVPEPATLALFGTGLLGMAGVIRRRFLS